MYAEKEVDVVGKPQIAPFSCLGSLGCKKIYPVLVQSIVMENLVFKNNQNTTKT